MKKLINFFKDEEGASMVEYALLVALIAVVVALAVGPLGRAIATLFNNVAGQL
jgi:pilus assembly protein Flp/PilA